MDKLRHLLNYLFNPNYVSPKEKDERIKYLNQFKKSYPNMTTDEKIMSMSLYTIEFYKIDILRNLGALEATLMMVGELECGTDIPENETYKAYILRLTKQFLTKTGCYEENKTD